jgi:hypothetical protein
MVTFFLPNSGSSLASARISRRFSGFCRSCYLTGGQELDEQRRQFIFHETYAMICLLIKAQQSFEGESGHESVAGQ